MSGAHVAAGDCETCRPGRVAQPANTVSSLAYVGAAVPLVRSDRPTTRALGWAAVAAGLGSVAYHGPGTVLGRYVHDAGLLALLGLMAVDDLERALGRDLPVAARAAVPAAAAIGAAPALTDVAQPVAGGLAAAAGLARSARSRPRPQDALGLVLLGVGATLHLLGRTGGLLCRPDARVPAHALWHVASAAAVPLRHA